MNTETEQADDGLLIHHLIQIELEKCPSAEICAKIKNPQEKQWCISYVFGMIKNEGMNISEGIGQLEMFLNELHH